jgi:hypothetical protein
MRSVLFCSFVLSLLTLMGCAKNGPKVVPVSGKVTREGNPYPNVFLNFEPEKGRPSWAQVDAAGNYTVKYDNTQDGAVTGKHKVWISYRAKDPREEMIEKGFAKGKSSRPKNMGEVLTKFGDRETSPLIIEITKPETNLEIKLD